MLMKKIERVEVGLSLPLNKTGIFKLKLNYLVLNTYIACINDCLEELLYFFNWNKFIYGGTFLINLIDSITNY